MHWYTIYTYEVLAEHTKKKESEKTKERSRINKNAIK